MFFALASLDKVVDTLKALGHIFIGWCRFGTYCCRWQIWVNLPDRLWLPRLLFGCTWRLMMIYRWFLPGAGWLCDRLWVPTWTISFWNADCLFTSDFEPTWRFTLHSTQLYLFPSAYIKNDMTSPNQTQAIIHSCLPLYSSRPGHCTTRWDGQRWLLFSRVRWRCWMKKGVPVGDLLVDYPVVDEDVVALEILIL